MERATLYRVHISSDLTATLSARCPSFFVLNGYNRGAVSTDSGSIDAPVVSHRLSIPGPGPARLRVSRPFPQMIRQVCRPLECHSICNPSHAFNNPTHTEPFSLRHTLFGSYLSLSR